MKVRHTAFPPARRVLAVSDIHGNLPFLKGLLAQVAFGPDDTLVIVGDILERGAESLATLRYVMALAERYTVHVLSGNCDSMVLDFVRGDGGVSEAFIRGYLKRWGARCCLLQMGREIGFGLERWADLPALRRAVLAQFEPELAFLEAMPVVLEAGNYLFVHGGVPREDRLEELAPWRCMKCDDFMGKGYAFQKWVVAGHWPVTLYDPAIPSARPLIDRRRHIVSIDGGCSLKLDGQLNALILPPEGSEEFAWVSYDGLPTAAALEPQAASEHSLNLRWCESEVEVLERGPEFSLCRHKRSGRVLSILTEYLYERDGATHCEDSTDYRLPVEPGDVLSVVRRTSRGTLAKKDGVTGWYLGRLGRVQQKSAGSSGGGSR